MKARLGLLALLVVSGILLAVRGLAGPIPLHVNSPMNLEGVFALAFLAMLVLGGERNLTVSGQGSDLWLAGSLGIVVIAAFAGALDFPFLADDYAHIWNARHADARAMYAHFTVPEEDYFFRPAVYCSYALDAFWAGLSPLAWRASNLGLHVVNTALVFVLCRTLGFGRAGSFAGALIFGLHGSRPEAVTWVAARFDLMAVMFGVASVLVVLRRTRWWVGGGLLALAVMSKESAYVVPGLIALALWYTGTRWSEIGKRISPLLGIEAVALVYRIWLLGGIGGYRDSVSGSAVVFHFGLASTVNALLLRFWAAMIFPLNWTGGLSRTAGVFLAAATVALIYVAWRGTERRKVVLGVGAAMICALPVHQFLAIGPDLEKSRVLYFASVGLALLFAAVLERMDWKLAICGAVLAGFQWAALENNLGHWKRVGELAGKTCAAGAREASRGPVAVVGLPNVVDGVYFLHMGFPECVQFLDPQAIVVTGMAPGVRFLQWDSDSRVLKEQE